MSAQLRDCHAQDVCCVLLQASCNPVATPVARAVERATWTAMELLRMLQHTTAARGAVGLLVLHFSKRVIAGCDFMHVSLQLASTVPAMQHGTG